VERFRSPDTWVVAAPVLCAVHCAATPLLVLFLPALALTAAQEAWLLAFTAAVAIVAVSPGIRVHRRLEVLLPVLGGLMVWGAALADLLHPLPEAAGSALGALVVAAGLFWNARLRHQKVCPACEVQRRREGRLAP